MIGQRSEQESARILLTGDQGSDKRTHEVIYSLNIPYGKTKKESARETEKRIRLQEAEDQDKIMTGKTEEA